MFFFINFSRLEGLVIDSEMELKSGIKCCVFDEALDVGILGTDKSSLLYINWQEDSSVHLVSSHTAKINSICCIDDRYLSTVGDDGSLNIWSLMDRERIVQFEVKSQVNKGIYKNTHIIKLFSIRVK